MVLGPNGQGGGMYLNGDVNNDPVRWYIANNTVISNTAASGLTFTGRTYCAGGGLRLWIGAEAEGAELTLGGNRIEGNAALAGSAEDIGLSRIEGGGASVVGFEKAQIVGNDISNNVGAAIAIADADNDVWGGIIGGGGLYLEDVEQVVVRDNKIDGNVGAHEFGVNTSSTSIHGGGVHFSNVVNAVVRDNTMHDNLGVGRVNIANSSDYWTDYKGGGFFTSCWTKDDCRLEFTGNELKDNVVVKELTSSGGHRHFAVMGGGAHIQETAQISVTNNTFVENRAGQQAQMNQANCCRFGGGGLATERNDQEYIVNNTFRANVSVENLRHQDDGLFPVGGGVALILPGESTVEGNEIIGNRSVLTETVTSGNHNGAWPSSGGIDIACYDVDNSCRVLLKMNEIADNVSAINLQIGDGAVGGAQGGAITVHDNALVTLDSDRIVRNHSALDGPHNPAAIYTWKGEIVSTNDVVAFNSGGFASNTDSTQSDLTIRNDTIVNNDVFGVEAQGVAGHDHR